MRDPEQPGPFVCGGEFVEVSPPAKLVYTWSWETPGMEVGESLVTVEFIAQGEMTELVLVHERLPDQQAADKHTEGWTACIANFVSLLESD
ncbi:MAG: SRPBCC domain-containing protein [Pirellulales bacterium]|nr:SRPBCC domain-containing protein [Pirellulales bacterium]